jgi:hypothetical protein
MESFLSQKGVWYEYVDFWQDGKKKELGAILFGDDTNGDAETDHSRIGNKY